MDFSDLEFDFEIIDIDIDNSLTLDDTVDHVNTNQIVCDVKREINNIDNETFPLYFGDKCPYTDQQFIASYLKSKTEVKQMEVKQVEVKQVEVKQLNTDSKKINRHSYNFRKIAPKLN